MPDFSDQIGLTPEDIASIQNYQFPQVQTASQTSTPLPGDFTPMDVPSWMQSMPSYTLNQTAPVTPGVVPQDEFQGFDSQGNPIWAPPVPTSQSSNPMVLTPEDIATIQNYQNQQQPSDVQMPTWGYPTMPTLPESAYTSPTSGPQFGVDDVLWANNSVPVWATQPSVPAGPASPASPAGPQIPQVLTPSGLTTEQIQNLDIMASKLISGVFANSSAAPILAVYGVTPAQALSYFQQTNPLAASILATNLGTALPVQQSSTSPSGLVLVDEKGLAVATTSDSGQKARLTQIVSYLLVPGALVALALFMAYRATKADEANSRPRPPVYIPERRYEEEKIKRSRKK